MLLRCGVRYLGLLGYALEWLLEASHASSRMHKILHSINTPKADSFSFRTP